MKISRDNYEQYFLDHAEGNLSPEMEKELALFLEVNPDLRPLLDEFDPIPLPVNDLRNDNLKSRLKKNINPTSHIDEAHVEEWLIRDTEGLLSDDEKAELAVFLKDNPAFEYDRKLYELTKLSPDLMVSFPKKSELKKKSPVAAIYRIAWAAIAVAAMILIFFGIRYFNQPVIIHQPEIAETVITPEVNQQVAVQKDLSKNIAPKGTPSQRDSIPKGLHPKGTPSLLPGPRPASFRMQSSDAVAINLSNPFNSPEPVLHAFELTPFEITEEKNENPILGKVFGNMVLKARTAVRNKANIEKFKTPDLNIWSIAEAGVKGFNTISDRDIELMVRRDADGKIKSYALVEEDRLLYSKSLNKN